MIIEIHYKNDDVFIQEYIPKQSMIDNLLEDNAYELKESRKVEKIVIRQKQDDEVCCQICGLVNSYSLDSLNRLSCEACGALAPINSLI